MKIQLRMLALGLALAASAGANADPTPARLEEEIGNLDRILFDSFNHCDQPDRLAEHAAMFVPELEFYHDLGGVTWTREAMIEGVRNNVCGKFARELVPGSMKVYPIKDFGALSTGTHRFCHFASGRCEGEAEFSIVWRLKDSKWEVTRVLSYAHRPLPDRPPPAAAGAQETPPTQVTARVELPAQAPLLPKPATTCTHDGKAGEVEIGYCHALRVGDTLYISGVVGAGAMPEAVAMVYGKLQATLRQHGLGFMHVVKENAYALDLDAFKAANGTRKDFYGGALPAATWVQVDRLFQPEFVLEVELVAKFPN